MKQIEEIKTKRAALVLHGINDLRYEEVDNYKLEQGKVLVKIKYCGICSSDKERIFITGTYHFPTIPGHEMSGQIVAVNDEDTDLLGKRVCVFPMLPCMKCQACQNEEYAQCSNYNYFGSRCDGGFSEYLLVPKWNLVIFDDKLDYQVAALCEPSAVSLHAINIGEVHAGDVVAVVGTGTIGFLIAFFARSRGANVFMAGRNKDALAFARENQINSFNLLDFDNELRKKTNGKGFDKVFEVVGSNESINQSIKLGASFSTIVIVGNPKENVCLDKDTYWKILRKQMTIKGTWNSHYSQKKNDWKDALELMTNSDIPFDKIITKVFRLQDKDAAFRFFLDNEQRKLKVLFKND